MLEQLHRYTHENINTLSIRKLFSAVLAIYFTVHFNNNRLTDSLFAKYIKWPVTEILKGFIENACPKNLTGGISSVSRIGKV